MKATDSRQRTVPVTCATSDVTISAGSLIGRASTFATSGTDGRLHLHLCEAPRPSRRRQAASARNGRERTRAAASRAAHLCPSRFRRRARPLPCRRTRRPGLRHCRSRPDTLVPARPRLRPPTAASNSSPSRAAIAPAPTGTAACMARPRMRNSRAVSEMVSAPAAASAEYSPSEWPATNAASRDRSRPASRFKHAHGGERDRHQRGLRVLGQREPVGRALPHDRGQLLAERVVDFAKHLAGGRKGVRERLAHADGLAALPRENKCDRHAYPSEKTRVNASIARSACQVEERSSRIETFRQPLLAILATTITP